MSAETGLSTELVYVRLSGEGTIVYRPARANCVAADVVELIAPDDFDPEDEEWEFKPGTLVRVERRLLEGEEVQVAVEGLNQSRTS